MTTAAMTQAKALRAASLAAVAAVAMLAAGCGASTGNTQKAGDDRPISNAMIEVEDNVGFTITEEVRVNSDLRLGYEEALALLERGEHERGIAVLERIANDGPGLVAPRIDLGIAMHRKGDLERAESYLDEALALSPDHPIVHNELGIVYRKTGRFDAARQSYERALAVFPGYHYARRNLAVLCDLYLADLACARENYEAYMTTVLEDAEAEMWLADVRLRLGE